MFQWCLVTEVVFCREVSEIPVKSLARSLCLTRSGRTWKNGFGALCIESPIVDFSHCDNLSTRAFKIFKSWPEIMRKPDETSTALHQHVDAGSEFRSVSAGFLCAKHRKLLSKTRRPLPFRTPGKSWSSPKNRDVFESHGRNVFDHSKIGLPGPKPKPSCQLDGVAGLSHQKERFQDMTRTMGTAGRSPNAARLWLIDVFKAYKTMQDESERLWCHMIRTKVEVHGTQIFFWRVLSSSSLWILVPTLLRLLFDLQAGKIAASYVTYPKMSEVVCFSMSRSEVDGIWRQHDWQGR